MQRWVKMVGNAGQDEGIAMLEPRCAKSSIASKVQARRKAQEMQLLRAVGVP
jgi:hypothetical protein